MPSSSLHRSSRRLRAGDNRSLFITALIAIALSFLVAIAVMLLTGVKPLNFFKALLQTFSGIDINAAGTANFFKPRFIGEFLQIAMPLVLSGLSLGFAYRTGMFNIGSEGQVLAGIVCADLVALLVPWRSPLLAVLAVLGAALGGAMWAFIPGLLKAYFGVHEVVTTIMFNYIALHLNNLILKSLPGSNPQRTVNLPANAMLQNDFLRELTDKSRFHMGFILVILAILLYNFLINRTTFGYELRAVGANRDAAEYAGINAKHRIVQAMMISGFFAGLAGACVALGTFNYGRVLAGFENYGFDGIAVGLLGGSKGVGVMLGGLLLGGLRSGQALMQAKRVPLEIAQIVSGLIILFVAMQRGIEMILLKIQGRHLKRQEAMDLLVTGAVPAEGKQSAENAAEQSRAGAAPARKEE